MAGLESLDALVRAVRVAWLRGCEAAAVQYQVALAGWMTVSSDGSSTPRQAVFRPPQGAPSVSPQALEIDWADLFPRRWMRPASLSLSFDCELRRRRNGSWLLHIVDPDLKSWLGARPRHRVEIVIDGEDDGGGEVRFDGHLLRQFGTRAKERRS